MLAQAILGPGAQQQHLQLLKSAGLTIASSTQSIPNPGPDLFVVLGGDGTIHRFLPDLIRSRLPVLVFPCGSGNDLARALGIDSAPIAVELACQFARGDAQIWEIDLGIIADSSGSETPFCCTAGLGLDTIAAEFANRLPRWIRARGGYLLGATRSLCANPRLLLNMTTRTAEGSFTTQHPSCLLTFANTPSFGGGLRIAPHAQLDDGQLECILVEAMSRAKLMRATISLLNGTHLELKEVHSMATDTLHVECNPPTQVYADGEYVCRTPVDVRILPRALRVLRAD